ncbi:MAG TPA: hypothetical protein VIM62_06090 [Acidobacteriaceae bacterium]
MTSDKENVVISAGGCSVTLLPQYGGKLAAITANGHQLLQPPLAPYAPRTRETPFDASDASGWDECLPSVGACAMPTESGPALIPDHGDLWRVPWRLLDHTSASATLCGACFSLPLELTRSNAIQEISTGWRLNFAYTLINTGAHPAPWSWAAHSLFTVEPGDTLRLPREIRSLRLEGSGGDRLGRAGDTVSWPIAALAESSPDHPKTDDLRIVKPASTAIGDKLFAGPISNPANGWCAIHRPTAGLRITIRFDVARTPYLGLWICYGGWPDRPGPKQVCVAPEPATAPVDSLAAQGPWNRLLNPGESYAWPVHLDIELLAKTTSAPDKP